MDDEMTQYPTGMWGTIGTAVTVTAVAATLVFVANMANKTRGRRAEDRPGFDGNVDWSGLERRAERA